MQTIETILNEIATIILRYSVVTLNQLLTRQSCIL